MDGSRKGGRTQGKAPAPALLPLAAGAFTYVAASDLVLELRRSGHGDSLRQIGLILLGLGLMALGARLD